MMLTLIEMTSDCAAGAIPIGPEPSRPPTPRRRARGRPKGSRSKAKLALEAILDDAAEELMRNAIGKALAGDGASLRYCLTRLLPVRRERPVKFDLPPIESAADLVKASDAVLAACAAGTLTPGEAKAFMKLIDMARAIYQAAARVAALLARLQACEDRMAQDRRQRTDDGQQKPSLAVPPPASLVARDRCNSAVFTNQSLI